MFILGERLAHKSDFRTERNKSRTHGSDTPMQSRDTAFGKVEIRGIRNKRERKNI